MVGNKGHGVQVSNIGADMRKFLFALIISLIAIGSADAARVTKAYTFSVGKTIRSADVNKNFDDIYNEFNGGIEGGASGNIQADSLTELEMADDINPRIRWDEGFQDWVYTGLQPATSANLTSDISAGTAYVNGYRVNKASATSKTYTNTKDTYVDIDYTGTFHYTEAVRMAAAPAVYTDSIRLAVVTSQGTALTQVTDLRVLTPYSTGSSKDMITRGFELVWASTTTVTVNPGTLYVNVTQVDKTTATTLDITDAGDAIDGATAQQATSVWRYVYVDNAGNCKLWSVAPTSSDTSSTTAGTKLYYKYGSTWYRCVGAIRLNATGSGEIDKFFQQGNIIVRDVPASISTTISTSAWSGAISCAAAIPPISQYGRFGIFAESSTNTRIVGTSIRPNGETYAANQGLGVDSRDSGTAGTQGIGGEVGCFTDSSQQIQRYDQADNAAGATIWVKGFTLSIR